MLDGIALTETIKTKIIKLIVSKARPHNLFSLKMFNGIERNIENGTKINGPISKKNVAIAWMNGEALILC